MDHHVPHAAWLLSAGAAMVFPPNSLYHSLHEDVYICLVDLHTPLLTLNAPEERQAKVKFEETFAVFFTDITLG